MKLSEVYGLFDHSDREPVTVEEMNEAVKNGASESVLRSHAGSRYRNTGKAEGPDLDSEQ